MVAKADPSGKAPSDATPSGKAPSKAHSKAHSKLPPPPPPSTAVPPTVPVSPELEAGLSQMFEGLAEPSAAPSAENGGGAVAEQNQKEKAESAAENGGGDVAEQNQKKKAESAAEDGGEDVAQPKKKKPRAAKEAPIPEEFDVAESDDEPEDLEEACLVCSASVGSAGLAERKRWQGACLHCKEPCYEDENIIECKSKNKKTGQYRPSYYKHSSCDKVYRTFSNDKMAAQLGKDAQQMVKEANFNTKKHWYDQHGGMIPSIAKQINFKLSQTELNRDEKKIHKDCDPYTQEELHEKLCVKSNQQERYNNILANAHQVKCDIQGCIFYMVPRIMFTSVTTKLKEQEKLRTVGQDRYLKPSKAQLSIEDDAATKKKKKRKAEPKEEAEPRKTLAKKIPKALASELETAQEKLEQLHEKYEAIIADFKLDREPDSLIPIKLRGQAAELYDKATKFAAQLPDLLDRSEPFPYADTSTPHATQVREYIHTLSKFLDTFKKVVKKLSTAKHMVRQEDDTDSGDSD